MGDTAQATEWNARLTELKQKRERGYTLQKTAQKMNKAVPSSTLLKDAPITSEETEAP
ncbi:hypothetical protein ACPOL_5658 [Acidisarcina polymorpha]|uniref:Uncharacterized protein n=1 Tax=Acidisarcina polymorpha TaxID=2211140 RepID=A0A2Z5G8L3_9BACT|nr:hypothetical protein [Acidisarcina polymorpha]AXC14906.1 hypothetical protein ACPOL_5658 [Acidisarcina polymorpha]